MSRCNIEIRVDGPCQDAGEGLGFQEESEVAALLNCVSTSYAYSCEFGVPCDGSQGPLQLESAVRAVVVDAKTCVQESLHVFTVAHSVIVSASGLPVPSR